LLEESWRPGGALGITLLLACLIANGSKNEMSSSDTHAGVRDKTRGPISGRSKARGGREALKQTRRQGKSRRHGDAWDTGTILQYYRMLRYHPYNGHLSLFLYGYVSLPLSIVSPFSCPHFFFFFFFLFFFSVCNPREPPDLNASV
jgi:hypothetical protein